MSRAHFETPTTIITITVTPPAQRVQFILGEDANGEDGNVPPPLESHPLFSEMEELVKDGDEIEW
jgi:solute carrier family 4 (sodium bicarbonate transporter), member 10